MEPNENKKKKAMCLGRETKAISENMKQSQKEKKTLSGIKKEGLAP